MADGLRLALLGAGRIGQVHALTIHKSDDAGLAAVVDAIPEAAEGVSRQFGCPVSTLEAVEDDPAVDGVVICTPTDTHADLIERFARAGKAIFCEKPIDLSVGRVEECLKVVETSGAALMLGFNRRFDPEFMALNKAIRDGRIGSVETVQITSRDPVPPPVNYVRVSGGIFRDMMIHDFDMARFMLGEEPVSVMATGSVLVDDSIGKAGDFDTASALLTTASGRQCVITNSRRARYGYDQRVEVHGSEGMASVENQRETSLQIAGSEGYTREPLKAFFLERYARSYANELAEFVAALREGRSPSPTGSDGLKALRIADAAVRSAETGNAVRI